MSLAEIEKAVDELSPEELRKLAAHIARRDKLAWDEELEADFSPGGKHYKILKEIDTVNFHAAAVKSLNSKITQRFNAG